MVSALFAGEGLEAALRSAADASAPMVAAELNEIGDRLEVGMEMEQAVSRMAESRDSEGVRLFTRTLVAKIQSGGDLAPVLKSVAQIMRDRIRMRLRLQAQMAGARLAAIMIAILPYVLLPVFLWRRPEWLSSLFGHPFGVQLFIAAILLQIVGFLWLRRLMRVEVTS
jgi:Flp pilus assembly protein TadB